MQLAPASQVTAGGVPTQTGRTPLNGLSGALSVGRVLGVPVRLHWTWFLTLALVPAILSARYFPDRLPGAAVRSSGCSG